MPRPLRIAFDGALYHVTARGVNRRRIFTSDGERMRLLQLLATVTVRRRWKLYSWCLMGNHFHLVLQTPNADISIGMQWLNGVYAQEFNRRHRRIGHLFQGRFHTEMVEREPHLLEAARYVVRNPVRAGLCREAREWPWSSYRATAGEEPPPAFLARGPLLELFSSDERRAEEEYRDFVAAGWP